MEGTSIQSTQLLLFWCRALSPSLIGTPSMLVGKRGEITTNGGNNLGCHLLFYMNPCSGYTGIPGLLTDGNFLASEPTSLEQ